MIKRWKRYMNDSIRVRATTKRRRMLFDLGMCYGLPIIIMALRTSSFCFCVSSPSLTTYMPDYVVQGHRFDILEYVGCLPATYFSIPGVFIIWVPPLVLSLLTAIYASK